MKIDIELVKNILPEFKWEMYNDNICAKSGLLRFSVCSFGQKTEVSVLDLSLSRNIFMFMHDDMEMAVKILRAHCLELIKAFKPLESNIKE